MALRRGELAGLGLQSLGFVALVARETLVEGLIGLEFVALSLGSASGRET